MVDGQADFISRTNLVTLPLYNLEGERLDVLMHLRTLQTRQLQQGLTSTKLSSAATTTIEVGDWPLAVKVGKRLIVGQLCAVKKSEASTEKGQRRVKRESQRCGSEVRPET